MAVGPSAVSLSKKKYENPKVLFTACLIGFLATGIPYWMIPYSEVSLPGSLVGMGTLVVFGAAFYVRVKEVIDFWMGISFIGSVVPAVVMVRVIVDCFKDPTAHNLWPFEIVLACFVGFGFSLLGSFAGEFYKKFFGTPAKTIR